MTYNKFGVSDNAVSNLDGGITASTTTITITTGEGALFPAGQQFIGTLVQYTTTADPTSGVVKSEKVLVTNRTTDTLTVTRGYDGDTGTTFDSGDYFYLNVTSKVIEDIQDEVTRLETDKLDKDGELRTGNGAWKVIYNDASGDETELALGTTGKVLQSNGATSAPTFETPTVDINGLTESTSSIASDDMLVMYDTSLTANKKHLAKASVTNEGLVEMCTDAEAIAGTDEERYINSKQAKDNYLLKTEVITSNGRSNDTASGTVTYNHNLGVVPKLIQVVSSVSLPTVGPNQSFGAYDGTNNKCSYINGGSTGGSINNSAAIVSLDGSAKGQTGVIGNLTTTTFDVVWTYTPTPSPAAVIGLTFTLFA